MMKITKKTPPWVHALLAWGLLALALGAAATALAWPAWAMRTEQTRQQQDLLRRIEGYQQRLARRPSLEAELAKLAQDTTADHELLNQPTAALAAAELQRQVRLLVEQQGGQLQSSSVFPPREEDNKTPFRRVSIAVRLRGDIAQLLRSLHGLEQSATRILLDNLLIYPLRPGQETTTQRPILEIQLELSAFLAKQESS